MQFKSSTSEDTLVASKVENLSNVDQLMINIKSNIYIVKGEVQNILVEGPEKILQKIETVECDGCLTIKNREVGYLAMALNFFNSKKSEVNIYITLPDLNQYNLADILNNANIKFSSADRMGIFLPKGKKFILESKKLFCCL